MGEIILLSSRHQHANGPKGCHSAWTRPRKTTLSDKTRALLIYGSVALAAVLPFLVVLGNGFLEFDDGSVILEQAFLREPGGIWQCLWPFPFREEPLLLRDVTYWLSFQLHGEWAPGFAAVDLVLHAGTALAVLGLGRRVFSRWERLTPSGAEAAALAGALLFALHPIHVESVAWLSARKDVLSGVFYLCAACKWLDYLGASEPAARRRAYLWTGVLYLGALGSKSGTVSFPLILVAADFLLGPRRSLKERVLAVLPYVILTAAYVKGYTWLLGSFDAVQGTSVLERHPEPVWRTLPLTNAAVVEQYLARMVLPLDQRLFAAQPYRHELTPAVIRALVVCSLVTGGAAWIGWRQRPLGFLFAWIPLALAPYLNIVATGILYAERYTYLASVGVCLLLGVAGVLICSRLSRITGRVPRRLVLGIALGLIAVPASLRCSQLARAFHDDGTLWTLVLESEPDNYIGLGNLANYYGQDLDPLPPPDEGIPADYGTRVARVRDGARAEALNRRVFELRPTQRNARRFGRLFERLGRLDEALAMFKKAVGPKPGDPRAWFAVARIYTKRSARNGHRPLAPGGEPEYVLALRIYDYAQLTWPTQAMKPCLYRARTLEFVGRNEEAIAAFEEYLSRYADRPDGQVAAAAARKALVRLQGN